MKTNADQFGKRIKPLREDSLTDVERNTIRRFLKAKATRKDTREFARWFKTSCKHVMAEESLDGAIFKSQKHHILKRIRFHGNKITPAPKRAAIERNRKLIAFLRRYLRRYGVPKNIGHFITRMRRRKSKVNSLLGALSDRAVRYKIQNIIGNLKARSKTRTKSGSILRGRYDTFAD